MTIALAIHSDFAFRIALLVGLFCVAWSLDGFCEDKIPSKGIIPPEGLVIPRHYSQFGSSLALAGKGRYLAMSGSDNTNSLLDFTTMKMIKIPVSYRFSEQRVAGTATKLLCMSTGDDRISRFDLKTLQHEKTLVFPEFNRLGVELIAGAYGNGPLGVITKQGNQYGLSFIDVETLEFIPNIKPLLVSLDCQVSSDGRVFSSVLGDQLVVYDFDHLTLNEPIQSTRQLLRFTSPKGFAPTNFNGSIVYSQIGPLSRCGEPLSSKGRFPRVDGIVVPASHGNMYAVLGSVPDGDRSKPLSYAAIYSVGDLQPIVVFQDLPFAASADGRQTDHIQRVAAYNQLWFVPEYDLLAVIGTNSVHIRKLSVTEELVNKNSNLLFVDSVAPANTYIGKTFEHEINVVATRPPVKFELIQAPKDARLEHNILKWRIPVDFQPSEVIIRVEVSDAEGKKIEYPIPLQIVRLLSSMPAEDTLFATPKASSKAEMREWKDPAEKILVRGRFIRIVEKKLIEIELVDGSVKSIALRDLCLDDIKYALAASKAEQNQE